MHRAPHCLLPQLKNITQAALAEQLAINKNYLSHIESGSVSRLTSDLEAANRRADDAKEFLRDMHQTFREMKELNSELESLLKQMDALDV